MKTYTEFLEDNMAALKLALAKHKYKQAGGKIDKQPAGPTWTTGSQKMKGQTPGEPDDDDRGKAISDYRKKKWKEKKSKKK
tara:strand:+ start:121 stop:363 length:243 start_codon:yes stop_codon:yes gene_type:complete